MHTQLKKEECITDHKDDCPAAEEVALEALVDDPARGMYVQRSEYIIEEEDLRLRIHSACESDAGLLATAERQALLTHLRLISCVEHGEIAL